MSEVLLHDSFPFGWLKYDFQVEKAVQNGERPRVDGLEAPASWVRLMKQCWSQEPRSRPDMMTVLRAFKAMDLDDRLGSSTGLAL